MPATGPAPYSNGGRRLEAARIRYRRSSAGRWYRSEAIMPATVTRWRRLNLRRLASRLYVWLAASGQPWRKCPGRRGLLRTARPV